jgi:nickel/cobalt transporter (NicO) family protein
MMYQVFIGSLILSLIHALIPNHWLPLIAVGKTEKWTNSQTLWATVITGIAHTLSTIIIGIVVGLVGYKLSSGYSVISETIAPLILVGLGLIYVILDLRSHHHHHHHHHEAKPVKVDSSKSRSRWIAILTSLSIAMFLTPCIEIEAYYFQAGTIGWIGIFIVSAVYLLTTVLVMLALVYWGMKGARTFQSHFLEHHEKRITGIVLIALGILALFVRF